MATSTFGWHSTTNDVLEGIDFSGKRVLITGVSAGLGVETARALVAHGAEVVGVVRDVAKARKAIAGAMSDADAIALAEGDLASLASLRACADRLLADGRPFDVIIGNAGIMACPQGRTVDGFELQFGTNHLGHFVLINRVAPLLRPGGRVVMLASAGHRTGDVDLDDPNFENSPYEEIAAYGRSKTANILFAVEFDRRHRERGIRATALHPGGIYTELMRHLTPDVHQRLVATSKQHADPDKPSLGLKSVAQGAATSVWAGFVAPADLVGGRYCEDCQVVEPGGSGSQVRPYAIDPARAKALWTKSEELVGEHFA